MLHRICLGAPVIVQIPDPQHEGRFRRVLGRVRDRIIVSFQVGAAIAMVCLPGPSYPYLLRLINKSQRRFYFVRLGNNEIVVVCPNHITSLQ